MVRAGAERHSEWEFFAFAQLIRFSRSLRHRGSCWRTRGLLRGLSQGGYVMTLHPARGEALVDVRTLAGDA